MLKAYRPGDPCCLCGQPMYPPTRDLHADHDPATGGYRGLAHAQCNVSDGARRGRSRQDQPQRWAL
ncbi:MAG: endonuclease domain-containing protein [Mycobacteriaceae bacterium]